MLKGKTAVITGASRGIGRQIALTFAAYGARVIVNYNSASAAAEEVVDAVKTAGGEAYSFQADVGVYEEAEALMRFALEKFGRIDILVNNAGITRDNLMGMMSIADFDEVIRANLAGTFHCMKSVYKTMLKQRSGKIINLSSVVGITGNAGQANYSASKAGIIGLTKSAAKELGGRGITVNAIAPGYIKTEMTAKLSEEIRSGIEKQVFLKRLGEPADIAEAAAFLASDRAAYITGQVLQVDGGLGI